MQQLVEPNLKVTEYAGLCLKFVRRVYGAPAVYGSAWEAWKHAAGRHTGKHPADVSVPVWFSHYGTYGSPPKYDNFGHVVAYVPGKGYLSSPGSKHGSMWFKTIADIERYFSAKYVGWSEGINGVDVVGDDDLGGVMGFYKDKGDFQKALSILIRRHVPLSEMKSAMKDEHGNLVDSNVGTEIRRATVVGYQNRVKNDRLEGKVDALALAVQQLSGGKIDMAAIEKAAFEGAAQGARDVNAAEIAGMLEISVRDEDA